MCCRRCQLGHGDKQTNNHVSLLLTSISTEQTFAKRQNKQETAFVPDYICPHLCSLGICIELVHQQVVVSQLTLYMDISRSIFLFSTLSHLSEGQLCSQLFDTFVIGEIGALLLAGRLHLASQSTDLRGQLSHLGPGKGEVSTTTVQKAFKIT